MTSCQVKLYSGMKCSRDASESSYFWYYDAKQRINRVFHMCQDHSNEVLNVLLESEKGIQNTIDRINHKIDALKPNVTFNTKKDLDEFYRRRKVQYENRTKLRRHTCRYCDYPLIDPNEEKDQIGKAFSHADFHSGVGRWRESIMFHTECGISWLLSRFILDEKELKYVRPKLKGQEVLI